MTVSPLPRIIGFDVPPLKETVDVVRDAPLVGLLNATPDRAWRDAFIIAKATTRGTLDEALVSMEGDHVLFFASVTNARARCDAVRAMVEEVSGQVISGEAGVLPDAVAAGKCVPSRGRVLVVEDDEVLLDIACDLLVDAGWTATPASGVADAIAALEDQSFDAVMTDIDLFARADGLSLARDIRQRWPQTGVVVVTGRHQEGVLPVPEGAMFLSKPYRRRQLLALLHRVAGHVPAA